MSNTAAIYRRHRYPGEIIAHAVWLHHRFTLSYRDVDVLLAERGVRVSYETVGQWCRKFGPAFAVAIRRRRPDPRDTWHLDEVRVRSNGRVCRLWRGGCGRDGAGHPGAGAAQPGGSGDVPPAYGGGAAC